MHPADIQAELKKAGITQKAIALEYGCSEYHVSRLINTCWGSEPLMVFIAKKLSREPYEVFPQYILRTNRRDRKQQ